MALVQDINLLIIGQEEHRKSIEGSIFMVCHK